MFSYLRFDGYLSERSLRVLYSVSIAQIATLKT